MRADVQRFTVANNNDPSPNYLVRLKQNRLWNREPKRLRSLDVNDQIELGWLLNRKGCRRGPLQDLGAISRRSPEQVHKLRPVGNQYALFGERSVEVVKHHRQASS